MDSCPSPGQGGGRKGPEPGVRERGSGHSPEVPQRARAPRARVTASLRAREAGEGGSASMSGSGGAVGHASWGAFLHFPGCTQGRQAGSRLHSGTHYLLGHWLGGKSSYSLFSTQFLSSLNLSLYHGLLGQGEPRVPCGAAGAPSQGRGDLAASAVSLSPSTGAVPMDRSNCRAHLDPPPQGKLRPLPSGSHGARLGTLQVARPQA